MKAKKYRKGFSLPEMVIVLVIIGIVAAIGIGFGSKQISKTKMNSIESNLRIVGSDIEKAIVDLGFLENVDDATYLQNYFLEWDAKYTTCRLDVANLTTVAPDGVFGADYSGVIIDTVGYKDPWDTELRLFYMIPINGGTYRIIVASAGPNSKFAPDAAYGYLNSGYDDDVMIVMTPRALPF